MLRVTSFITALLIFANIAMGASPVAPSYSGAPQFNSPLSILARSSAIAATDNITLNAPMSVPAWVASTKYFTGEIVSNSGRFFQEQFGPSCTSAGSGGPTTAGGTYIADSTCLWNDVTGMPMATAVGGAPTLTLGSYWAAAIAYPVNSSTINFSGSGTSTVGNLYKTTAGGTTAVGSATGQATFATNVMTVTTASTGTFAVGQTVVSAGVAGNTVITSLGSGVGGTGTYNLSTSPGTIGTPQAVTDTALGPTGNTTFNDGTVVWTYVGSSPSNKFNNANLNGYVWNTGSGTLANVANFSGGNGGSNGVNLFLTSSTINGSLAQSSNSRYEFVTDAPKFILRLFDNTPAGSIWRIGVCNPNGQQCHWVSPNHLSEPVNSGWDSMLVDFTQVGGRQERDIIVENTGSGLFQGIDTSLGDTIHKPSGGGPTLVMGVVGDSYPAGGGVAGVGWAYPQLTADLLGIRSFTSTAIGACGWERATGFAHFATNQMTVDSVTSGTFTIGDYVFAAGVTPYTVTISGGTNPYTLSASPGTIASEPVIMSQCSSGTETARIGDVTAINGGKGPDILLISNGTNNLTTNTANQITADLMAYVALRIAASPTTPVVVQGAYAHNSGGVSGCPTCVAVETAEAAAIAALNNPLVTFCPWTNDPAGAWETGTGSISSQNGTGNTDWYFETAGLHPNYSFQLIAAARLTKCIRNMLAANHY